MVAFIKDTIGTDINLRLAIDVPQILCNLKTMEQVMFVIRTII